MPAARPNLLFIMTDQQRFDTLTVNGNPAMRTPVLDALARSGANLQRYYTNAPVCGPSRACLFTGRYPHSHRVRENYCVLEAGREIHLFRALKQAGYSLGYCGKNHLVDDQEKANFDFFDGRGSDEPAPAEKPLMDAFWAWRNRPGGVPPGTSEIWRATYVHDAPPESTRTWQTAQAGVEFLQRQHGSTQPFALCVSFEDPHVPHLALREYFEKYPLDQIDLIPFDGEAELATKARRWAIKYGAFNAEAATDADKRRYIAVYRAMISWVDTQVGRLLAALDATGRREDTLVVFTSDHGDFNFQHGLAKKDLVLAECLLHVPCLFSWPGRIAPRVLDAPDTMAEEVDIVPTLLELLGLDIPVGVQGRSFAPLVLGRAAAHKDVVFAEVCPPYLFNKYADFEAFAAEHGGRGKTPFNVPGDFTKAIRERRWRYVWYGNGEEELYDLDADPLERRNLAADPAHAAEKTRLRLRLLEWNALTEDPLDANLLRDLQARYDRWIPLSVQSGKHEHPRWKETIHLKLAKTP
jgi:arylsulfatase A-like enzyme